MSKRQKDLTTVTARHAGNREPGITEVTGIGQSTAEQLAEHGIRTIEELAAAPVGKLAAVRGFGARRAASVRKAAAGLLRAPKVEHLAAPTSEEKPGRAGEPRKDSRDKKRKKKKKRKKRPKKKDEKKNRKKKGKKGRKKGRKKKN